MATVERLIAQADPAYRLWLDSIEDDVIVDNGVALHCRHTLPERNATYEVATYLPGHLMIGDDSGGNGFVIACDGAAGPVFRVDLGSLHEDDFKVVAPMFETWVREGLPLPPDSRPEPVRTADVYIDQVPADSVRVLARLNKLLGAGWRVGDLRRLLHSQPIRVEAAHLGALRHKLEQTPELWPYLFCDINGTLEPVWPRDT